LYTYDHAESTPPGGNEITALMTPNLDAPTLALVDACAQASV
jgi:hypothetical protein